ncbi:hypothetical protein G9C85_06765 [Halorubellus sp. JP-L1]|uniref:hypothetical protein n=1 Tax=Halorubellus sp. JP-L1 TaxID=2715753 RepID=UPI00140BCF81|nr:hypothetical protein [Halorubellus sp. JP-L1]NHN41338.1 hypothetical protein [Halorubellus sp. JP-L1]
MPSRRSLLRGIAAGVPAIQPAGRFDTRTGSRDDRADRADADEDAVTVGVAVHRVPSIDDAVYRRVRRAVDSGVEQVARNANAALDRRVDHDVVAGATAGDRTVVTNTSQAVWESTADWLDATDRRDPDALHLMLVDAPFGQSIGYGGNRTHLLDGGPVSFANVGATERWDDAAVTANMAIHEVLHGLVTPSEAREVVDRGCEHDLGAVIPVGDGRSGAIATPLATAYAETTAGGETQWPGSGCLGRFSRDVGYDPDWWGHTYALSPATLDATARYVARL